MKKQISRRCFLSALTLSAGTVGTACVGRILLPPGCRAANAVATPVSRTFMPMMTFPLSIYGDIKREALTPNSEFNHPLPLVGSWNASTWWNFDTASAGLYPGWQLEMIDQGHHLLPWFNLPEPNPECEEDGLCVAYLKSPLKEAAQQGLPISFIGTQWEHHLYDDPAYLTLPPDQNPNVVSSDGAVQKLLSPFGPAHLWYEVGRRWGASRVLQHVISLYPDPPLVVFISNNEALKLSWTDAETDKHYLDTFGYGRDDDFKRREFGAGWTECYNALTQGFRDGLNNPIWQANARFVGYEAFGPGWFGRWDGWKEYSLYIPNRIDPDPLFWQGGSPSLYICANCDERDNNIRGQLFHTMNWVFMAAEAAQLNPFFWFEFSCWDGDEAAQDLYAHLDQLFSPARYVGYVQFGMWAVRPRVVRVYRDWSQSRAEVLPWFTPVMQAVDRLYSDPVLRLFWRSGRLTPNRGRRHPYQSDIPAEYSTVDRMFLLSTGIDPPEPWSLDTEFEVMCLARVVGTSPNRRWLVYGYAPLGARNNVPVMLPGFGTIHVDVAVEGSFTLVDETDSTTTPLAPAAS